MKDENGIEICCKNCRCVCKYDSMCLAHTPPSFFRPTSEAYKARIAELQNSLDETEKKASEEKGFSEKFKKGLADYVCDGEKEKK